MPVKKILLLEDNIDLAIGLETILKTYGHDVSRTIDGEIALSVCEEKLPDLVITDLALHKMDGVEFLSKFREYPGAKEVPVIAMTGVIDRYSVNDIRNLGVREILLKPFNLDHFMTAVRASLP